MPENTTEERPPQLDNVRDNATQEDFKMKNKVKNFPEQKEGLHRR